MPNSFSTDRGAVRQELPMISKSSYALTGVFVLVLGIVFIWGVLWISAGGPPQNYDHYLIYITDSVSGMNVDAPVRFRGVDVGKVERIEIDMKNPERVRVQVQVVEGTPITVDTVANLEYQGLTGIGSINLAGGGPDSVKLSATEGEIYPVIKSRPSLYSTLDLTLSNLLENLTETSASINQLLNEQNRANISRSIENVATLTEQLETSIGHLTVVLENTRTASVGFPSLVNEFSQSAEAITRMADQVTALGEELASASAGIDRAVTDSGADLTAFTGATLPEISAMVAELRQVSENLRRMSEALAQDPSLLLYGVPEPKPGPGE